MAKIFQELRNNIQSPRNSANEIDLAFLLFGNLKIFLFNF